MGAKKSYNKHPNKNDETKQTLNQNDESDNQEKEENPNNLNETDPGKVCNDVNKSSEQDPDTQNVGENHVQSPDSKDNGELTVQDQTAKDKEDANENGKENSVGFEDNVQVNGQEMNTKNNTHSNLNEQNSNCQNEQNSNSQNEQISNSQSRGILKYRETKSDTSHNRPNTGSPRHVQWNKKVYLKSVDGTISEEEPMSCDICHAVIKRYHQNPTRLVESKEDNSQSSESQEESSAEQGSGSINDLQIRDSIELNKKNIKQGDEKKKFSVSETAAPSKESYICDSCYLEMKNVPLQEQNKSTS